MTYSTLEKSYSVLRGMYFEARGEVSYLEKGREAYAYLLDVNKFDDYCRELDKIGYLNARIQLHSVEDMLIKISHRMIQTFSPYEKYRDEIELLYKEAQTDATTRRALVDYVLKLERDGGGD